jgi:hypothetical protein
MNKSIPMEANWGNISDFEALCKSTFSDQNKNLNTENQLVLLKQGSKTA